MKKLLLLLLFIPLVSFGQKWEFVKKSYSPSYGYYVHDLYKSDDGREKIVISKSNGNIKILETYNNIDHILTKEIYNYNTRNHKFSYEWSFKGYLKAATISLKNLWKELYAAKLLKDKNKTYDNFVKDYSDSARQKVLYNNITPLFKRKNLPESFIDFQKDFFDLLTEPDHLYISNNRILDGWQRTVESNGEVRQEGFYIFDQFMFSSGFNKTPRNNLIEDWMAKKYNKLSQPETIEEFDLEPMVNLFLDDYLNNYLEGGLPNGEIVPIPSFFEEFKEMFNIKATFVPLEGDDLALSYGLNDDKNIILKVDPEKWAKASSPKRWYTLYHELGHDVLNFEHGQGGKMMFNFANRDYNWETFEKDRNYMFKKAIENAKKRKKLF
jgi:hypothetical protein